MTGELTVNGTVLDLKEGVSFPFNYSIADIKDPQKRKRNYSRSVKLPGTQTNLEFFASTYQLALSTVGGTSSAGFGFDPTIRIPAKYKNKGSLVFNGLLQLNQVIIENNEYTFECTLFSDFIELFMALGDMKVSELGWSEYNHALTRDNIKRSWNNTVKLNGVDTSNMNAGTPLGFGYHYGLVDYGYPRTSPKTFKTVDLYPMVYWREVFTKCLAIAGIKHTSVFLDSVLFRKFLLGYGGGDKQTISPAEIANRRTKFAGSINKVETRTANPITLSGVTYANYTFFNNFKLADVDNGFTPVIATDVYQQYDQTTGLITVERSGYYTLNVSQTLNAAVNAGTMTQIQGGVLVYISILRNGAFIASNSGPLGGTIVLNKTLDLELLSGDVIELRINFQGSVKYQLTGGPDTLQPLTITLTDAPDFSLDLISKQSTLNDNDTVELARFIPDLKASDFMTGVITAFNLYISDPDIDGFAKIEPLNDFYGPTNEFDDWTDLLDHSRPVTIKPASRIEGKTYNFLWTEDGDYDNKRYRDRFGIGYGDYAYQVESTFAKGNRDYKLPFAQTIPTDELTPLVVPRIISIEENTNVRKPFKGKPRVYVWNGLKTGAWRLANINSNAHDDLTTYPSVHHFDNWQNPTFDLNFGLPIELQYTTSVITNANLFNVYHRTFIREITGRDSKIVEAFFKLSSKIISENKFGRLKMLNGVLFRLNEIKDFDDNSEESTMTELVKVVEAKNPKKFGKLDIIKGTKKDSGVVLSPATPLPGIKQPSPPVIRGGSLIVSTQNAKITRG